MHLALAGDDSRANPRRQRDKARHKDAGLCGFAIPPFIPAAASVTMVTALDAEEACETLCGLRGGMSDVVNEGAIAFYLILAGVLTFILGGVALVLRQRAILRHMATSAGRAPAAPAERPRRAATAQLVVEVDRAATATPGHAERILRRMAI